MDTIIFFRLVDMKVGQLVQMESFSLFDAMCAIVVSVPDRYANNIVKEKRSTFIVDLIIFHFDRSWTQRWTPE